jgi:hypothetical protein
VALESSHLLPFYYTYGYIFLETINTSENLVPLKEDCRIMKVAIFLKIKFFNSLKICIMYYVLRRYKLNKNLILGSLFHPKFEGMLLKVALSILFVFIILFLVNLFLKFFIFFIFLIPFREHKPLSDSYA